MEGIISTHFDLSEPKQKILNLSNKLKLQYKAFAPHLGIICVALFALIANLFFSKTDLTIAVSSEGDIISAIDPVQEAQFIRDIDQYTYFISEDTDSFELAALLDRSDGYLSKDLGDNSVSTQIAKKDFEYSIQQGETISGIANKFDIHVVSLVEANKLSVNDLENLKSGQNIIIPANDTSDSMQWLTDLNSKKEAERQLALKQEQAKQAKLAAAKRAVVTRDSASRSSGSGSAKISTGSGSSNNGYPYGYCTYYVASRRSVPSQLGNAGQWIGNARRAGFATGGSPVPGAIMVTNESWVGHVAYVESVNGDTITISEMNYKGWGVRSTRTIDVNNSAIKGFIY